MEYESRRDADDAYHEMHNKRIGRDDMLKIEVSFKCIHDGLEADVVYSGRVLHLLLRGDLTRGVIVVQVAVVNVLRAVVAVHRLLLVGVVVAITLLERMIVVTVTMNAAIVTAPGVRMIEIGR